VYDKEIAVGIFFAMSVAVKLATNYGKISRQGTATILLSKQINCIAINTFLIGTELYCYRYFISVFIWYAIASS
jgi:hypothetical protein